MLYEINLLILMIFVYAIALIYITFYFFKSLYDMIKFLKGKKVIFEVYFLILLTIIEILKYIKLLLDFDNSEFIFKLQFLIVLAIVFINMKIWHNKKIEIEYRENVFKVSFYLLIISSLFSYFSILYNFILFLASQ
ncbi:hypothetical protein [Oceanivirga salmonicida]|uniref:hypothetical protein n=1 Tax=Oceanivirga salmonicida TaxID=1769291 RepID=UPI0012E1F679|nr:hypothetical protein [Oceanivirga salmonicida]